MPEDAPRGEQSPPARGDVSRRATRRVLRTVVLTLVAVLITSVAVNRVDRPRYLVIELVSVFVLITFLSLLEAISSNFGRKPRIR